MTFDPFALEPYTTTVVGMILGRNYMNMRAADLVARVVEAGIKTSIREELLTPSTRGPSVDTGLRL
jgi:hypothetical protein